jgi:hypothetical protein
MIGDGQHAPSEIKMFGSQMQERLFAGAAHFPGHSGKRGGPAATLADFDDAGGNKFLEAGLQFHGEFRALNYKKDTSIVNHPFIVLNSKE